MAQLLTAPWRAAHEINTLQMSSYTAAICPPMLLLSTVFLSPPQHSSHCYLAFHTLSLWLHQSVAFPGLSIHHFCICSVHIKELTKKFLLLRPKASDLALQTLQKFFLLVFRLILKKLMVCGHHSLRSNAPRCVSSLPLLTTLWMHLWCGQISHIPVDCPSFLQGASYNADCDGDASRNTSLAVAVDLALSSACSV